MSYSEYDAENNSLRGHRVYKKILGCDGGLHGWNDLALMVHCCRNRLADGYGRGDDDGGEGLVQDTARIPLLLVRVVLLY